MSNPNFNATANLPYVDQNFIPRQRELTGSFVINNLQDLLNSSESYSATEIVLKTGFNYLFTTIVSLGTRRVNLNGAALSASVEASGGLETTGTNLYHSVDNNVSIRPGFLSLGGPNTSLFNFSNPVNKRNNLSLEGIFVGNNSKSTISGFRDMSVSGTYRECSSAFEFGLTDAESLVFNNLLAKADNTVSVLFQTLTEGSDILSIVGINLLSELVGSTFSFENTTQSCKLIGFSTCIFLNATNPILGVTTQQDNVRFIGCSGVPENPLTGELIFTQDIPYLLVVNNENEFYPIIPDTISLKPSTAIGVVSENEGYLKISREEFGSRVTLIVQICADTSGGTERVCRIKIQKRTLLNSNWVDLDQGAVFTTRRTADSVSLETTDICLSGDEYRCVIANLSGSNNIKIWSYRLEVK